MAACSPCALVKSSYQPPFSAASASGQRSSLRGRWRVQEQRQRGCRSGGGQRPLATPHASSTGGGSSDDSQPPAASSTTAIPTRLNNIPHERETRKFFYQATTAAAVAAVAAGEKRISISCTIPELNREFDVFRVGTLLELVREMATALSQDGRRVKVCVQQALGEGIFKGLPLSLSSVMRIMKQMDWGSASEFISLSNLGKEEVESADVFIIISPQNIVGFSVLPFLSEMVEAAAEEGKPILLLNPKLGDIPSSAGIMGTRGRQGRLDFLSTFVEAYHFRLLYKGAFMYPIMGAMLHTYGGPWEVYKRVELEKRQEEYRLMASFKQEPNPDRITKEFRPPSSY